MAALLPERPKRGHKGPFGKVLVVAGSLDYAGAALLVCRAAGRAGAGLVTLAVPESLQPLFAAKVVEATTMGLPEDDVEEIDPEAALARILDHEHDAIVVGPGLRPGLATAELVRLLIRPPGESDPAPIVLDAEALRSLATMDGWWEGERRPAVLTPHAGEFARLRAGSGHAEADDGDLSTDDRARVAAARDAAGVWRSVVVLKGARTVIADMDGTVAIAPFHETRRWPRAGPAMSSPARSARCWPRAWLRSPPLGWGSTCTAWPASRSANDSAMPGSSPPTCPTGWRSPESAWRPWRSVDRAASAWALPRARSRARPTRGDSLNARSGS